MAEWRLNIKPVSNLCTEYTIFRPNNNNNGSNDWKLKTLLWGYFLPVIGLLTFLLKKGFLSDRAEEQSFDWLRNNLEILLVMLLFLCGSLLIPMVKNRYYAVEESVLIVKSLGIQVSTKYASGRSEEQFLESSCVSDIIINEGISMQRIVFYLAILLKNTDEDLLKLIPLFQHSMPRLPLLRSLYTDMTRLLGT